jgi:hypothetical protein
MSYLVIHKSGLIEAKYTIPKMLFASADLGFLKIVRIKVLDIDKFKVTEIYKGDGVWEEISCCF